MVEQLVTPFFHDLLINGVNITCLKAHDFLRNLEFVYH